MDSSLPKNEGSFFNTKIIGRRIDLPRWEQKAGGGGAPRLQSVGVHYFGRIEERGRGRGIGRKSEGSAERRDLSSHLRRKCMGNFLVEPIMPERDRTTTKEKR